MVQPVPDHTTNLPTRRMRHTEFTPEHGRSPAPPGSVWDTMSATSVSTDPAAIARDPGWRGTSRWALFLLIVATSTWRPQVFYEGGVDPIVAMKALIVLGTIALAWFARTERPRGRRLDDSVTWLLTGFLLCSTFGGWVAGHGKVDLILGLRVFMLAVALVLLVKTFPAARLVRDLIAIMALISIVAIVTGLPAYAAGGERLRGGIPPLHPNELAFACAIPSIGLGYLLIHRETRLRHILLFGFLMGGLWLSGSRTSLLGVLLALVIVLVQAQVLKRWIAICLASLIPVLVYIALGTGVLNQFANRGGEGRITTLNSRSIAWAAAGDFPATEFNRWFGSGISIKMIPVAGQYWEDQALDSSWVSAFIQAGWIGIAIMVAWWLLVLARSFRLPLSLRPLVQGLLAYILVRTVLENGMVDSSPMFVAFFLLSLVTMRRDLADERTEITRVPAPGAPSARSRSA